MFSASVNWEREYNGDRHVDPVQNASKSISRRSPTHTILNYAIDLRRRTWRLNHAIFVAHVCSVMALHQAGVDDAVIGGVDADAASGFLHDDSQDEAMADLQGGD